MDDIPETEEIAHTIPLTEKNLPKTRSSRFGTTSVRLPMIDFSKEDQQETEKTQSSSRHAIFFEEEIETDPLKIEPDSSPEFRHALSNVTARYKIEKQIASGGFGDIYLADDLALGRKVVIKTLKEDLLSDDSNVAHFISEAKLSSQLEHPAIVPLYTLDSDEHEGLHLAMQYVRGITLKVYLARSRKLQMLRHSSQSQYNKELRERLEMFLHVCNAIEFSHSRGIAHNDLKPENIMLARFGQVFVMDWGLASYLDTKSENGIAGTPAYMAPEYVFSRISNQQTDVFALGMILNEVATLRGPITGKSSSEIAEKVCRGQYEPSTCIDPKIRISPALSAIIETARHQNVANRYPDVRHLAIDVRHYLFNEEIRAYPEPPLQKLMRLMVRHRTTTFCIIALLILITACSIFFSFVHHARISQQVNTEMLRGFKLQNTVDHLAMNLGRRIILIQEQLRSISNTISVEMENQDSVNVRHRERFYMNEDFAPGSAVRPPGLIHTPFYKEPVTLDVGTCYCFNPELSQPQIQQQLNKLVSLHSQRISTLFMNIIDDDETIHVNKLKRFLTHGSMVRRIMVLMDNGVVVCYPGMFFPAKDAKDFQSDYIRRERRIGNRILWAPPFRDDSGHIDVACWGDILDSKGESQGLVGFNLSYQDIVHPLVEQAEKEKGKAVYIMVDSEEQLIFTSDHSDMRFTHGDSDEDLVTMTGLNSFRYPQLIRRIKKQNASPQFTMQLEGKMYRISWARVPFTGWLLIQKVALEDTNMVDSIDENLRRDEIRKDVIETRQNNADMLSR